MINAALWGRVYAAGYGNLAFIKVWNYEGQTAEIPVPHFESAVDVNFRVWPEFLKGLSGATGQCEGYFNSISPVVVSLVAGSPVTDVVFSNGLDAIVKLYTDRRGNWGYAANVWFPNFRVTVNEENQPVAFSANFRVNGVMPLSAVI